MHLTVVDRLEMRARARASGDVNLERACNADLARYGYRDAPPETTAATEPETMERAVPAKPKRGRPPRPRCEHGQIVGRCTACEEDENEPEI